jgi:hypothetical protein
VGSELRPVQLGAGAGKLIAGSGELGIGAGRDEIGAGAGRGTARAAISRRTVVWPETWPAVVGMRGDVDLLFLLYILIV